MSGLINVKGLLYGTTSVGGRYGKGTVFMVTLGGKESVIHDFRGRSDGVSPESGLIDVNGVLYGTTCFGGGHGRGSIFTVSAGTEKILYSFKTGTDGVCPEAQLTNVNGKLYGTTQSGGSYRKGTVFRITVSGIETVLYSFKGSHYGDGMYPEASVISVGGNLYGTTWEGGNASSLGTVFRVTLTGRESVVHTFVDSPDGSNPEASLVEVGGKLYSTTISGGKYGPGSVFSLSL